MLFNSWLFVAFFAIVYTGYLFVKNTRFATLWLLIASYIFYASFKPWFLYLIIWITLVDWLVVIIMDKWGRKKRFLLLSILNDLFVLGFFKYGVFFTDNANTVLGFLGTEYQIPVPNIVFPVAISFYIFQSLTYTIDFYRHKVEREHNIIRYAAFVAMFPQLLAGPIQRANFFLPQLKHKPDINISDVTDGMSLFIVGLFKKVALANYFALYVDEVYMMPDMYQAPALMLATFLYAWQIYFDFSGYTDMARGVARMMGFNLKLNFNNPYLADSLGDFWGRWHISLSSWFKDYVYIPLGGNKKGKIRTYFNMCATMIISGLWHGAQWTFVMWGVVHALGRVVTRELERTTFYREKVPRFLKQTFIFTFVCFCWIFFRAENISSAWLIITRIFTSGLADPRCPLIMIGLALSIWIYQYIYESRFTAVLSYTPVKIGLVVAMALYITLFTHASNAAFIYFQF